MTATPVTPSDLMVIVLAYKNGEADWPTTKTALLAFPYAPEVEEPAFNTPEWAAWYNSDPPIVPNSHEELASAGHRGDLEWDRYTDFTTDWISAHQTAAKK